jgi:thiol-disulfide isomerase/thioredoxin
MNVLKPFNQMNNMLVYLVSASLFFSCSGNPGSPASGKGASILKGKLSNSSGEMIFLQDASSPKPVNIDSIKLNETGEFEFHTAIPYKGFYNLYLNQGNFATLILDAKEKVTVSGDAKNLGYTYKTEGSPDTKLFMDFNTWAMDNYRQLNAIKQKQDSISGAFQFYSNQNKDKKKLDSLSQILEPAFNKLSVQLLALEKEKDGYAADFIDKNPGSFADMAVLGLFNDKEANFSYFEKVSIAMKKKFPEQKNLKPFYEYVEKMKRLSIGSPAPEIKLTTPEGKELALSSLRGKIVLVDFWASWCGPCRKENPNVRKIYAQYHAKGFEVFSVSLDDNKEAWIKAISDDHLEWNHVSELKKWQSAVVPLYDIKGIPMTVLLDKEGNIVAKNLRGEQLAAKVAELLK